MLAIISAAANGHEKRLQLRADQTRGLNSGEMRGTGSPAGHELMLRGCTAAPEVTTQAGWPDPSHVHVNHV